MPSQHPAASLRPSYTAGGIVRRRATRPTPERRGMMADPPAFSEPKRHGRRRWVRVAVIVVVLIVALVVVLLVTGGHRPGPPPGGH